MCVRAVVWQMAGRTRTVRALPPPIVSRGVATASPPTSGDGSPVVKQSWSTRESRGSQDQNSCALGTMRGRTTEILFADARTRATAQSLEEIGKSPRRRESSFIEVKADRLLRHFASRTADRGGPRSSRVSGDWQKFKGCLRRRPMLVAKPRQDKRIAFEGLPRKAPGNRARPPDATHAEVGGPRQDDGRPELADVRAAAGAVEEEEAKRHRRSTAVREAGEDYTRGAALPTREVATRSDPEATDAAVETADAPAADSPRRRAEVPCSRTQPRA